MLPKRARDASFVIYFTANVYTMWTTFFIALAATNLEVSESQSRCAVEQQLQLQKTTGKRLTQRHHVTWNFNAILPQSLPLTIVTNYKRPLLLLATGFHRRFLLYKIYLYYFVRKFHTNFLHIVKMLILTFFVAVLVFLLPLFWLLIHKSRVSLWY